MRSAVLAFSPLCAACGEAASEVDHIVPLAQGGREMDWTNVQPLCGACHAAKTAAEA